LKLYANQANGTMITTSHAAYNFSESNAPFLEDTFPDTLPRYNIKADNEGHKIKCPVCKSVEKNKMKTIDNLSIMLLKTMSEEIEIPNPKQIGIPSPYQKSLVLVVRLKLLVTSPFMLTLATIGFRI
tara:strand:+ start:531 stop:911 length:381 start_codon:yes stop_codon:yes gene_type:complete